MCIYIYIYTYPTCMHACVRACMHVCVYSCMHACMHVCVHACSHTYVHTYIRTYAHTYIRTYVHTYIRTYIHTLHTYAYTRIDGRGRAAALEDGRVRRAAQIPDHHRASADRPISLIRLSPLFMSNLCYFLFIILFLVCIPTKSDGRRRSQIITEPPQEAQSVLYNIVIS